MDESKIVIAVLNALKQEKIKNKIEGEKAENVFCYVLFCGVGLGLLIASVVSFVIPVWGYNASLVTVGLAAFGLLFITGGFFCFKRIELLL